MAAEEIQRQLPNSIPAEDVMTRVGKLDVVHVDSHLAQRGGQPPRVFDRDNSVLSAVDDEKRCGLFIDVRQRRRVAVDIGNLREAPTEESRGELEVAGVGRRNRSVRRAGQIDDAGDPARVFLSTGSELSRVSRTPS